jgi:hypothetical protein
VVTNFAGPLFLRNLLEIFQGDRDQLHLPPAPLESGTILIPNFSCYAMTILKGWSYSSGMAPDLRRLPKATASTIHGHKFSGSKRRDPEIRYSKSSKILI